MHVTEHLTDYVWQHPSDYAGYSPDGDYCIYSRTRDSSILENSNYELILAELTALSDELQTDDSKPYVWDFRASHWAVGWVEYIIVDHNAPELVLIRAANIVTAISDYPVYDEQDYSERQVEAIQDYWDSCSLSEKIEWCKESGLSCFAARGHYPESIEESEMFY